MTPIQLTVLVGVLLLITAFNMKVVLWYIERKQAKQALQKYVQQEHVDVPIPFALSEMKCVDTIESNLHTYLDALTSHKMEKIGIMKEDALVAVMIPLDVYEKFIECVSQMQLHMTHLETSSKNVSL